MPGRVSSSRPKNSGRSVKPRRNSCFHHLVVVGNLTFRKVLVSPSALKYGTEHCMCHAQHVHGEKIAVNPLIQDVWAGDVCLLSVIVLVDVLNEVRIFRGEEKQR